VIRLSDEISHRNQLMTGTLEFGKVKIKNFEVLDDLKKPSTLDPVI